MTSPAEYVKYFMKRYLVNGAVFYIKSANIISGTTNGDQTNASNASNEEVLE